MLAEEQPSPSPGSREGKVVTPHRPPCRGFFSSQVWLSRDKEATHCIYPPLWGGWPKAGAFRSCSSRDAWAGCSGVRVREAGHRCSMMWLEIRRGFHPLSSTPCDCAGWLELRDPSLPHGQFVSHQPFIAMFCFLVKHKSST